MLQVQTQRDSWLLVTAQKSTLNQKVSWGKVKKGVLMRYGVGGTPFNCHLEKEKQHKGCSESCKSERKVATSRLAFL